MTYKNVHGKSTIKVYNEDDKVATDLIGLAKDIVKAIPNEISGELSEKIANELEMIKDNNPENFNSMYRTLIHSRVRDFTQTLLSQTELTPHSAIIGILAEAVPAEHASVLTKHKNVWNMCNCALDWSYWELRKALTNEIAHVYYERWTDPITL